MHHSSYIEVSRSALSKNLDFIRSRLLPETRFSAVVKGNAYGHQIKLYTGLASELGLNCFSVYSADEAYEICSHLGDKAQIYIMGMADDAGLEWAIEHDVEVSVFDQERLDQAIGFARAMKKKARIHLELETGMNRTGFARKQLGVLAEKIKAASDALELYGVFTHFAGAESSRNEERIQEQIQRYHSGLKQLADLGLRPKYRHAACSAALMNYPETLLDMVRIGIMQYGFWSNQETYFRFVSREGLLADPLTRLMCWKSQVMSTKEVEAGEYIGYSDSYTTNRAMKIAVVPVGYAHGYSRILSNSGKVLIRGMEARVTGLVNMNAVSVDITEIPGVEKGDEVVLIGDQGERSISVASFGEITEQLNYELLTRLPREIPRIVVD